MKPLNDYSWVRGVNHHPCPEERLRRELSYGRRINLNATRIWLSRWAYEHNPEQYLADILSYVRICYDCGYQVMPILFNGNGLNPETLTEAYYEKTLVGKTTRDEESRAMLDIIFSSRVYDLGWYFQVGGYNESVMNLFRKDNNNFASMYKTASKIASKSLQKNNEAFQEAKASLEEQMGN